MDSIRTIRRWTNPELEILQRVYPNTSSTRVAKLLGRTPKSVRNKASKLALSATYRHWSFPRPIEEFVASKELSYLIGAMKGDGSTSKCVNKRSSQVHYWIQLSAVNYDFVNTVRKAIVKITGRSIAINKRHRSYIGKSDLFRIQISNKSLHHLLSQDHKDLAQYIEPFPTDFLRGFFDAEGSAWTVKRRNDLKKVNRKGRVSYIKRRNVERVIKYCNTNRELMEYVKLLLSKLEIDPAPKMFVTKGNLCDNPKPCYNLHIYRKRSIQRFMALIGSSIVRKRII